MQTLLSLLPEHPQPLTHSRMLSLQKSLLTTQLRNPSLRPVQKKPELSRSSRCSLTTKATLTSTTSALQTLMPTIPAPGMKPSPCRSFTSSKTSPKWKRMPPTRHSSLTSSSTPLRKKSRDSSMSEMNGSPLKPTKNPVKPLPRARSSMKANSATTLRTSPSRSASTTSLMKTLWMKKATRSTTSTPFTLPVRSRSTARTRPPSDSTGKAKNSPTLLSFRSSSATQQKAQPLLSKMTILQKLNSSVTAHSPARSNRTSTTSLPHSHSRTTKKPSTRKNTREPSPSPLTEQTAP